MAVKHPEPQPADTPLTLFSWTCRRRVFVVVVPSAQSLSMNGLKRNKLSGFRSSARQSGELFVSGGLRVEVLQHPYVRFLFSQTDNDLLAIGADRTGIDTACQSDQGLGLLRIEEI